MSTYTALVHPTGTSMGRLVGEINATRKAAVIIETFGHLFPKVGTSYQGSITFAVSYYHSPVLLDMKFRNLEDSPLLYEDITSYLVEKYESKKAGLYLWTGWYIRFKNGKTRLRGSTKLLFPGTIPRPDRSHGSSSDTGNRKPGSG